MRHSRRHAAGWWLRFHWARMLVACATVVGGLTPLALIEPISRSSSLAGALYSSAAIVLTFVVVIGGVGLYRRVQAWEQTRLQQRRDARAAAIVAMPVAAEEPFCVYLRPFSSTGRLRILRLAGATRVGRATRARTGRSSGPVQVLWWDVESLLTRVLEPTPLIALGRPGEQLGAGRIPSSETGWREEIRRCMCGATAIFLVPSRHAGTRWEMDVIAAAPDLLQKTVFIVPPVADVALLLDGFDGRRVGRWKRSALHDIRTDLKVVGRAAVYELGARAEEAEPTDARADALGALEPLIDRETLDTVRETPWGGLVACGRAGQPPRHRPFRWRVGALQSVTHAGAGIALSVRGVRHAVTELRRSR